MKVLEVNEGFVDDFSFFLFYKGEAVRATYETLSQVLVLQTVIICGKAWCRYLHRGTTRVQNVMACTISNLCPRLPVCLRTHTQAPSCAILRSGVLLPYIIHNHFVSSDHSGVSCSNETVCSL